MVMFLGTDGFQSWARQGLIATHAYEIGRFLGWYHGRVRMARLVAGKDLRSSSYILEYVLSAQKGPGVRAAVQTAVATMGRRGPHTGLGVRHRAPGLDHGGDRKPEPQPGVGRECRRGPDGEVGRTGTEGASGWKGGGKT